MELNDAQAETLRLMETLGVRVVDREPTPGSPLARIEALAEAVRAGLIDEADAQAAVGRVMRAELAAQEGGTPAP